MIARDGRPGREPGKERRPGRGYLVARGQVGFKRLAQTLVVRGDALFQLVELRVLIDLPPFAAQHSVGGRGRLPAATVGRVGRRDDNHGSSSLLVGWRRFVAGTIV